MSFLANIILVEKSKVKRKIRRQRKKLRESVHKGSKKIQGQEKEGVTKKEEKESKREYRKTQLKLGGLLVKLQILRVIEYTLRLWSLLVKGMIYIFGPVLGIVILAAAIILIALTTLLSNIDLNKVPSDDLTEVEQGVGDGCGAAWTEEELATRGSLLTDHEKNMYRLVLLSRQFVDGELTGERIFGDDSGIALYFSIGTSSIESSMRFYQNGVNHNILKVPSDIPANSRGPGYALFGISSKETLDTYLNVGQKAQLTGQYQPTSTPMYTTNYAPYGLTMQMYHLKSKLDVAKSKNIKELAKEVGKKYGIEATLEEFSSFAELCMAQAGYHGISYAQGEHHGYLSYWAAMWAASNDVDSERGMHNITYKDAGYSESGVRHVYVGTKRTSIRTVGLSGGPRDLKLDPKHKSRMVINGEVLEETLWSYLDKKFKGEVPEWDKAWAMQRQIARYSGGGARERTLNFTYGPNSFIQGSTIMRELESKLTGDMCIGGGGTGVAGEVVSTGKGKIQGDWTPAVMEALGKSKYLYQFGTCHATENPESTLPGTNITYAEWRKGNKWDLPYYHQGADYQHNKSAIFINGMNMPSSGCHTVMMAAMASSITGKLIVPVEMGEAMRITGGILPGGIFNNNGAALRSVPDALGLHIARIGPSGGYSTSSAYITEITGDDSSLSAENRAKQKVDAILAAGGIVGTTMGNHTINGHRFTKNQNHYIVIMDKIGDEYQVVSYGTSAARDMVRYTWPQIFAAAKKSTMMDRVQIYLMIGDKVEPESSTGGGGFDDETMR